MFTSWMFTVKVLLFVFVLVFCTGTSCLSMLVLGPQEYTFYRFVCVLLGTVISFCFVFFESVLLESRAVIEQVHGVSLRGRNDATFVHPDESLSTEVMFDGLFVANHCQFGPSRLSADGPTETHT